ncbi:MAG: DNA polymerase III subunit tau [Chloroflexi bacterium ADurb.Bin325]|nr:MAG: DNA polymerase III subunit tau [Chloroflexi bacterium ADurb.Bin325]
MAQALYRKWRSQTFEAVVGQEHITATLRNALRDGRMSHAYLFTGPRGTGKTSTARILAKAINCLDPDPAARPCNACRICTAIQEGRQLDLIEIDAASNRGIDEIRDLREKIGFSPNEARYKIYIIDEVHMLTKEAFNALLKTLEEPPPHAVFVLATTEPDRVPETVRSRCQRFDFRRIPTAEIVEHLTTVLKAEGSRADAEALVAIARRATGSMRDAVSLLDQMLAYGDDVLTLQRVEAVLGLVNAQSIGKLVDCLIDQDTAGGLTLLNALVAEGVELGQLVDQIVAYLRGVLFARVARAPELLDLPQDVVAQMARQAGQLTPAALLAAVREFTEARAALRDQVPGVPQLPIEVAFLRAAQACTGAAEPPAQAPARAAAAPAVTAPPAPPPAAAVRAEPARTAQPAAAQARSSRPASADEHGGVKLQAALRAVREMEFAGQTLVMLFSQAFSRDIADQMENRQHIEAAWEEVLGRRVMIRCALLGETAAPAAASPAASPADPDEQLLDDARRRGAVVTHLKKPGGKPA